MQHIHRIFLPCQHGDTVLIDTRYDPDTYEILLTTAHITLENKKFDWGRQLSWFWGIEGAKVIEKNLQILIHELHKN